MQPTRTRRFPIKLFIKKRIFWSICGRPGFCGHIFAKFGSRPELVNFLLNCLLRNAFFGPICGHRTFALQFRAADSNSSSSYSHFLIDLRSSGLWQSHFGQPIRACRLPIKLCIKSLIFWPLAATRFCNHMLMAGLRRFRLAGARILKKPNVFLSPEYFGSLGGWCFPANSRGSNVPSVARFLKSD